MVRIACVTLQNISPVYATAELLRCVSTMILYNTACAGQKKTPFLLLPCNTAIPLEKGVCLSVNWLRQSAEE